MRERALRHVKRRLQGAMVWCKRAARHLNVLLPFPGSNQSTELLPLVAAEDLAQGAKRFTDVLLSDGPVKASDFADLPWLSDLIEDVYT